MKIRGFTGSEIAYMIQDDKDIQRIQEPLDGDEIEYIIDQIRLYLNFHQGNLTPKEFEEELLTLQKEKV